MIASVLFALTLIFPAPQQQASLPAAPPVAEAVSRSELQQKLLTTKRIYVDSFGEDAISRQLQAMVVSALAESKRFIVTENQDKADAILKGAALEKTSQEFHALNDKAGAATVAGGHEGSVSGSWSGGTGSVSGSSHGGFAGRAVSADDSSASTETIDHARLAVRLVSADGDVIWASTQESKGAKYKGASADVADKIVKQLQRDIEKLERPPTVAPAK